MAGKKFRQSKRFTAKIRKKRERAIKGDTIESRKTDAIKSVQDLITRSFMEIKKEDIIKYCRSKNCSRKNLLKFLVKTSQGEVFYFFFCINKKSADADYCLMDSTSHFLLIRVSANISQSHLTQSLKENIQDQLIGFKNEASFLKFANDACRYCNWMVGFKNSSIEEDVNGIDKHLVYLDKEQIEREMPFQLKSGNTSQLKHIMLFPEIPSIKWREGLYGTNSFVHKMNKMVRSFENKDVSHL